MRFKVKKEPLLKAINQAIGTLAGPNAPSLILTHFLFDIQQGKLQLSAYNNNLQTSATCNLDADSDQSATRFTLPGQKLNNIIRNVSEDVLSIEQEDEKITLQAGQARFNLSSLNPDDFHFMKNEGALCQFKISLSALKKATDSCYIFTKDSSSHDFSKGLLFEVSRPVGNSPHRLNIVGLDASHIAIASLDLHEMIKEPEEAFPVLPRKAAQEIKNIDGEEGELVVVSIGNYHFEIEGAHYRMVSHLIDINYPKYRGKLGFNRQRNVILTKTELMNALRLVAVVAEKETSGACVRFQFNQDHTSMKADNVTFNEEGQTRLKNTESSLTQSVDIGVNLDDLIQALSKLESSQVNLSFSEDLNIFFVEGVEDHSDARYVLSPLLPRAV